MNTQLTEWRAKLHDHASELATTRIAELFNRDPKRTEAMCLRHDGVLIDFSRNRMTAETKAGLLALARAADLEAARDAMFRGEAINWTEDRPAEHAALRDPKGGGSGRAAEILEMRERMLEFADAFRAGDIRASDGETLSELLYLGIGGSHLGPRIALHCFARWHDGPRVLDLASVDPAALQPVLRDLTPSRTLVLVSSKTFTTSETMHNAGVLKRWLQDALGPGAATTRMAAATARPDIAREWGIAADRVFPFSEGVGGRYSIWSSVGLPVAIAIGSRRFREFLAGAHGMDCHFRSAPLEENLPVMLGLVGRWNREFQGHPSRAVFPYSHSLAGIVEYLQQLEMESTGKSVGRAGETLASPSSPLVWGGPGTETQHSFFQFLHQGTDPVVCEFLVASGSDRQSRGEGETILLANCVAQCEALMRGRNIAETMAALVDQGLTQTEADRLAPYCSFPGDRPSTIIAYRQLDPKTLGQLLALYEHRVFVDAAICGSNAFDQMGVELGKTLASRLQLALDQPDLSNDLPRSAAATIDQLASLARSP